MKKMRILLQQGCVLGSQKNEIDISQNITKVSVVL